MARAKAKKKSSVVSIGFKGIQSRQLLPEDDYRVKLTGAETTDSKSSGDEQIEFTFEVSKGKLEGQKLWFYCPLGEKSLWKLHGLLTAMGVDVPDDDMDLDLEELVEEGHELMAVVQHETYDGTKRSKMMDFYAIGEDDDKDDEKPAKGRGKTKEDDEKPARGKGKKKDEPEKVEKEAVENMDRDELEELIEKMELDVDPDDHKKLPKLLAAVLEELEEKELFEEDEPPPKKGRAKPDEDDESPAAKRKARRDARKNKDSGKDDEKPAKGKAGIEPKLSSDEVQGMDEDELEGVVEKYELDVDLDDFKTLRKKASAVIDALEDGDFIEDDE
jgi:uncharacterized protein DUF669